MKKLIITAHPNPKGFTHRIAKKFVEIAQAKGDECFVMDLYDERWKQDFLMLDENNKQLPDAKREMIQEKITRAEELVFVFPLRWFDAPAIMKNWFDMNVTTGFAYRFKKRSLLPHRYLKGKSARIFFTSGSSKFIIYTAGIGILIARWVARFFYVGIRLKSYTVFGALPPKTELQREKLLAKVARIARR